MAGAAIPSSDLEDWREIGVGSFGRVYRVNYLGTDVACKEFAAGTDADRRLLEREIELLRECRHPNVVQFIGVSDHGGATVMVTEFVPNGSLRSLLENPAADIPWRLRVAFALDVARGATYMSSRGMIHRDIKSDNLLLTENLRVKIADFGFSRFLPTTTASRNERLSYCGTDATMAPEIILGLDFFDGAVDVFSYGIVLCELAARRTVEPGVFDRVIPGFGIDPEEIRTRAAETGIDASGITAPEAFLELAARCTDDDPKKRPAWKQIIFQLEQVEKQLKLGDPDNVGLPMNRFMDAASFLSLLGPSTASLDLQSLRLARSNQPSALELGGLDAKAVQLMPSQETLSVDTSSLPNSNSIGASPVGEIRDSFETDSARSPVSATFSASPTTPSPGKKRSSLPDILSRMVTGMRGSTHRGLASGSPDNKSPDRTRPSVSRASSSPRLSPIRAPSNNLVPISEAPPQSPGTLVAHRFAPRLNMVSNRRCQVCVQPLALMRRAVECDGCGFVAHAECGREAPATCGLSQSGLRAALAELSVVGARAEQLEASAGGDTGAHAEGSWNQ
ncbi:kinase-like domain-containing protein [Hyaloraphidium curvatum]|nr:kinase-like domain-containing protein [Hyaloraphidium curvatum]